MDNVPHTYVSAQRLDHSARRRRTTICIYEPTAHCTFKTDLGHMFDQCVMLFDHDARTWLGLDTETTRPFLFLKHIEMHRKLRVFVIFDARNSNECLLLEYFTSTGWCPAIVPIERTAHGVIHVEYFLEKIYNKDGVADELPAYTTRWRETFQDKLLVYSSHDGSDGSDGSRTAPKELTAIMEPIRWGHCDKCNRLANNCRVVDVGPMPGATMNVCFVCIPLNDA